VLFSTDNLPVQSAQRSWNPAGGKAKCIAHLSVARA
jgi:hypothetical protein